MKEEKAEQSFVLTKSGKRNVAYLENMLNSLKI